MDQTRPETEPQSSYSLMTAQIYDAIYAERDYQKEADLVKQIIADRQQTDGRPLISGLKPA